MHRSQLGGIIIDCDTEDLETAASFWSAALGYAALPTVKPEDKNYVSLDTAPHDLDLEVQKVDHTPRVHIDIETDDMEAEVTRLEKLGAKAICHIRDWRVMEAPTGHRFCVVPAQRSNFEKEAHIWP